MSQTFRRKLIHLQTPCTCSCGIPFISCLKNSQGCFLIKLLQYELFCHVGGIKISFTFHLYLVSYSRLIIRCSEKGGKKCDSSDFLKSNSSSSVSHSVHSTVARGGWGEYNLYVTLFLTCLTSLLHCQAFGNEVKMTGATYSLTWSPKHRWEHVIYHFHMAYRVIQPEEGPN